MTTASPTIEVRVTAVLQKITGGQKTVEASGDTVAEVLDQIDQRYPGFRGQLYDDDGKLHRFVNVYLNDEDIRYTGGVETAVKQGDVIDILPALAGGAQSARED
ncbi:MAG: MoaD family protein [Dehalococcoidia bacterium]|nr:MoaD family protein [Dehalococcoidia bacterium]